MKLTIVRTMLTTGLSLIALAVFFVIIGIENIFVAAVFQLFAANILINFGIYLRNKIEIRYFLLGYIIDVSYIILVLLMFRKILNWKTAIPVWYLICMAVIIYAFVIITTFVQVHKDTDEINNLLQKRRDKNTDSVS